MHLLCGMVTALGSLSFYKLKHEMSVLWLCVLSSFYIYHLEIHFRLWTHTKFQNAAPTASAAWDGYQKKY